MMKNNSKIKIYAILFGVALVLRLFLFFHLYESRGADFFNPLRQGTDQAEYGRIAVNLVDNGSFSMSKEFPLEANPARTPLFPAFLAFSYWATGGFIFFVFLNIFLASYSCVLVYKIALLITGKKKISFYSGLIYALLPYNAYISNLAMADTLFTLAFLSFFYLFLKMLYGDEKNYYKYAALSGLILGLATLVRPITQFFFVIPIAIIFIFEKCGFKKKIYSALLCAGVFAIIISPWLVRNKAVFGEYFLSSVGRYDIFISYMGPWQAYKENVSRSEKHGQLLSYINKKYGDGAMHDIKDSTELSMEAKKEILKDPLGYGFFHIMSMPIFFINNDFLLTLREAFHFKLPDMYIAQKFFSGDIKGLIREFFNSNWLMMILFFASYGLIFVKTIAGFFGAAAYFKNNRAVAVFSLAAILYFPAIIGPEGHARFRIPIEPILIIFSLLFLFNLSNHFFNKKNKKKYSDNATSNYPKLTYFVNARIPTEKAHGIQIIKTCEALAKIGWDVTLVIPRRINKIKENPFAYYGAEKNFKIKKMPVIDLIPMNFPFSFLLLTLTFGISSFFYLVFKKNSAIYIRGEIGLVFKTFFGKKFFWETHIKPKNINSYAGLMKNAAGIIVVNDYYKNELIIEYGIPHDKIISAPDGVDLDEFNINENQDEARTKLCINKNKKMLVYIGSFLPWKGADIFLKIAASLPDGCIMALVVGGEKEFINDLKNKLKAINGHNVVLREQRPRKEIPLYLKSADILLLPGTPKNEISAHYTSPLKLFEYMTSKKPILAADIGSYREILNDANAFFYKPDDPEDLLRVIKLVLNDARLSEIKALRAYEDVKKYTWVERAFKISNFIKIKLNN